MIALVIIGCITLVLVVALLVGNSVANHSITKRTELERAMMPPVDPVLPLPEQQALSSILERRRALEGQITRLRERGSEAHWDKSRDPLVKQRADALAALTDARNEQKELIEEQAKLLEKMRVRVVDENTRTSLPDYEPVGMEDEMAAPQAGVRRS